MRCAELYEDVETFDVRNPYDESLIASVRCDTREEVDAALARAAAYDHRLTAWERYAMLQRFCDALLAEADDFARLISQESGKTLGDAAIEVRRAHQAFLLSAEEAKRLDGEVVPLDAVAGVGRGVAMVLREPIGPVVAITPFNFPLNLVAHKVGPALAADNPVIVKPSERTPLTALKMAALLLDAGVPSEMLQVVNGDPETLVAMFCDDPRVRKISFTGSVPVGKAICQRAGMKRVAMELGGNDPMIVLADADIERAIPVAIDGAFGNNGERCTAIKRFIVEDSIADDFIERFVRAAATLRVGDQLDPDTDIGPLVSSAAAEAIEERVERAVIAGAHLRLGGRRRGALLWPIVLDHVTMQNPVVRDETFGPVAPFIRVSDYDEAIAVANDTDFGLQSAIFTNDHARAMDAVGRLSAGAVMVNRAPGFRAEHLPFGGVKDSGMGREGIKYAIESMTQLKTVVL